MCVARTKICELFGIEYPIITAGMGATTEYAHLADAVNQRWLTASWKLARPFK